MPVTAIGESATRRRALTLERQRRSRLSPVAGVKIHLGHVHRGKVVTVVIEDSQFRILHDGTRLAACPRTVIREVTRRSASGHPGYQT